MLKKLKSPHILFSGVLFLSGMIILLYPYVSNLVASRNASQVVKSYEDEVKNMEAEKIDAAKEAARKYNEQLSNVISVEEAQEEDTITYLDMVDAGMSMGYIVIPKIDVNLPIYSGIEEESLRRGVGHLEQSSYPLGGESTHCALSAHRGLPSARLFTDLDKMEIGDVFTLTIIDRVLTYQVDCIQTVEPENIEPLYVVEGEDYCTLVTCTPYGVNSHRMLVRGTRIENEKQLSDIRVTADAALIDPLLVAPFVAAPILLVLFILLMIPKPKKNRRGDLCKKS